MFGVIKKIHLLIQMLMNLVRHCSSIIYEKFLDSTIKFNKISLIFKLKV